MIRRLSRATRHNRFHGGINELPADTLRSMTQVDYRRHLAFVVTTSCMDKDSDNEIVVADAPYVIDDRGDGAEFAIVVDDRWQRIGLGERAMHALVDAASRDGLLWLHGSVLSANAPMLSLMRRCRFCCTPDREDDHLVHVETRLGRTMSKRAATHERTRPLGWLASSRAPAPT